MAKNITLLTILFTVLCSPFTVCYAMGTAPPAQEVEIIERIATQTEEATAQEKCEMKVLMEIPWGSKPGELGVKVVEGLAIVPDRLAVDGKGNVYIFDKANNRINKYNKFGRFARDYKVDSFRKLPPKGDNPNPILIQNDIDMGIDDTGNIYVLNSSDAQIRKLNSKGEIIDKLQAPANANYIRVERSGRVQAMRYKDGRIEMFDVSSRQVKAVSGFKTPSGLDVVIGDYTGVNEPRAIRIFNVAGNLQKELEIKVPYKLYEVNFIGTDAEENIYILIERESDETKLKEIAPGEFKTIRLLGYFIKKYDKTGSGLLTEQKFILKRIGDTPIGIPGFEKCFSLDANGNIYLLVMCGDPYAFGHYSGFRFKVFKWELKR
jgi:hypothetical protein